MTRGRTLIVSALLTGITAPAAAWAEDAPFTGAYAGPELGAHEHHFYLEQTDTGTGASRGRYFRAWGVGGGAFAGYDLAVLARVRVGAEIEISLGGRGPVARFGDAIYAQHPEVGLGGTGRVGYLLAPRLLAYGAYGYGGYRSRLDNSAGVADAARWRSSFTVGAGFEYRMSPRVSVRLDFRHLDSSMSHVLLGVPIRF